jgi:hypothetical protein
MIYVLVGGLAQAGGASWMSA